MYAGGDSLSGCAQWNVMVAPLDSEPPPGSAVAAASSTFQEHCVLDRCCLRWHFVLSFSSISATFGCRCEKYGSVYIRHCMSHVALELKKNSNSPCVSLTLSPSLTPSLSGPPLASLSRCPSDKVLSYDLLKCPNAAITRDYYKCIPRVQHRIRMRHKMPSIGWRLRDPRKRLSESRGSWTALPGNKQQIVLASNSKI